MTSHKISYDDLILVTKYLEKHCNGNNINLEISHDNKLLIKTQNSIGEHITIIIYREDTAYKPRIIKEDKLVL